MPAEGLIEIPPEIEANALADHDDGLCPLRAGAVPAQGHEAAVARRPPPDPEQRVHPELAHRLLVENVCFYPELFERCSAIREFSGKEHVRRLINEIAGDFYAVGDGRTLLPSGPRRGRVARANDELRQRGVLLVRLLLACLVLVETITAKPEAESEIRRRRGVPGPCRRLEGHLDLLRAANLAEYEAAEHRHVRRGVVLARRDADDYQSRRVETRRGENVEGSSPCALEIGGFGGGADQGFEIPELRGHCRRRLHVGAHKKHERVAFWRGQRSKGDFDGYAHATGIPCPDKEPPRADRTGVKGPRYRGFAAAVNKMP